MEQEVELDITRDASHIPWGKSRDWIDFAVLELQRSIPYIKPLVIDEALNLKEDCAIFAIGFPGEVCAFDYAESF